MPEIADAHWKTQIADLQTRALAVKQGTCAPITARSAASCLFGIVSFLSGRYGTDAVQRACADLARCDLAWARRSAALPLGALPRGHDGAVPELITAIAACARGILPLAGVDNVRAAVAFWASEDDRTVWQSVVGMA